MKQRRTWLVITGLVLLSLWSGWKYWGGRQDQPVYKTAKVERGAIVASVSASGTVNPVVSVQVGSQVSGQMKEVLADFNSEVKQGQLIARLDPETFEYRVRQAQADLEAARAQAMMQQAAIAAQKAQAAQVEVNAANARRDLERKQQLMDKGFISGAERDSVLASYSVLAEQVKAAKAQVQVAESNANNAAAVVKQREAALAQARVDLERTAIKAPVSGVVIKRSIEKGQTVAASLQAPELFVIAEDLTDMRVEAAIDESEIGRIREGQKATFTVDAYPGRTFEGTVKQIRKAAQNVSNVVTYMVEVSATNPQKELLPGMTANVRIVIDRHHDVLKVPNAALRFKPVSVEQEAKQPPSASDVAEGRAAHGGPGSGGHYRALRERLEPELNLSADQKTKLDAIFTAMQEKMAAAREAAPEERKKIGQRNRAVMREQINEILTPEQKKKYELINAEQGERRAGTTAPGRVYILDPQGMPREATVQTGLSDGRMTEVVSPELKEGMQVITGTAQSAQQSASKPAGSPAGPRMF